VDALPFELPGTLALVALVLSLLVLVGSALLVPVIVLRMPADYFVRPQLERRSHPMRRALRLVLGSLLLGAGVAMLVLPGQGVLTILAGLWLLPLRGKRKLELWLLRKGPIRRLTQALRTRAGKPPLLLEAEGLDRLS
jgi:hypothetical protein